MSLQQKYFSHFSQFNTIMETEVSVSSNAKQLI